MKFVRARKTAGVGLMAASLMAGIVAAPAAFAAEAEVPENAEEVTLERQAFWQANRSKFADNATTSQFPPQAVCLVAPNACFFPEGDELDLGKKLNETTATASEQEGELLATMAEADEGDPAAPVEEGDHPVSVAFGESNYRSAIDFTLPPLPEGEMVDSFTMVLSQGDPTYANESPAFRQAVLAALTCAREDESSPFGRCTPEQFEKIRNEDLQDGKALLVQACPITSDWKEGRAQSEDALPAVDCLYTAVGVPVELEGEVFWVFDLTFAAMAWYDGILDENGLLLAPGAAENLAYGDQEQTYSKQVTFNQPVQIALETSPEPATPPAPEPFDAGTTTGSSGSFDVFATPPGTSSGGSFSSPGVSSPSQPTTDQPAVSEPTETAEVAPTQEPETLAAGTPLGAPVTPWWLWLLVPTFLAGAWLLSRSLQEQAVLASERSGAMTRLLERQVASSTGSLVSG